MQEKMRGFIIFDKRRWLVYPLHAQPELEIIYITHGESDIRIDGTLYTVRAGDFVVIFPNQMHEYVQDRDLVSVFLVASAEYLGEKTETLSGLQPVSPILHGVGTDADFIKPLLDAYRIRCCGETPHSPHIIRGYLQAMFGLLLNRLDTVPVDSASGSVALRAVEYCTAHYREPLTLAVLEKALYVNRYYLSHIFSEQLHVRFCDYINALRVDEVKRLLESTDISLTELSLAAGFGSLRTFNRVFKAHTGITPREYRARHNR